VLARLLTPQDFGLIAMVTAVTGFVTMFKNMGLSKATVQKAEINHGQISTLFWINVVFSIGVMLVIAALAPAIAWFYGEPRLKWITLALAGAFIFGGLTVQHQALLRRNMCFGSLALIQIISTLAGVVTAIIAAFYGAGYWSLVLMQLATAIAGAIAVWVACGWRPGLPVWCSGVREMLAFGGNLTGSSFLNYFARNADNLLIGKFCGSGSLGLYSKAYGLLMLPLRQIKGPISAVAVPALSRLQNDPETYRRYYYRAISTIAFITMPLVAMLAALSHEIITIVLGKQWADSAIIFKVLAFAAVFQPIWSTLGWIYTSLGQTKRLMRWGLVMVPLIVLSFVIGLPWGALGVATSYTVCFLFLIMVPSFWYAFRYSPVSLTGLFRAIRCPLVLGLSMYCAMEFLRRSIVVDSSILTVIYCCALGICVFFSGLVVWPRARSEAFNVLYAVKLLRKPSVV
jgi:PST family polysaccharide transporter